LFVISVIFSSNLVQGIGGAGREVAEAYALACGLVGASVLGVGFEIEGK
jgi:hypothetical protein